MIYDGEKYSKAKKLGFRYADGKDKYADGTVIPNGNCVFFKLDNPERIISITEHSNSNLAYGITKIRKSKSGVRVFDPKKRLYVEKHKYAQTTMYLAYNGEVFKGSSKMAIQPKDYLDSFSFKKMGIPVDKKIQSPNMLIEAFVGTTFYSYYPKRQEKFVIRHNYLEDPMSDNYKEMRSKGFIKEEQIPKKHKKIFSAMKEMLKEQQNFRDKLVRNQK